MKNIYRVIFFAFIITISSILLSGCTISEQDLAQYEQTISEANLLIDGKEYNSAIERLSSASTLIPTKKDAYERIVDILIIKNRLEDAINIIDESATKLSDLDISDLYFKVGDAYYLQKEYDKALYSYQLAQGAYPSNKRATLGIGRVYLQKGKIEEGKSFLNENYEGDMYIEAQLLLSYVTSLSDIEEAREIVKDVEPGDTWRERYTQWNDVLSDLTDDELFNSAKLSKLYIDEGYPYLAIAMLEPKKDEMNEYIDGIYILGKAYYENKEYQESIDLLEDSTSLSDLNVYIYWLLARDYFLISNLEDSFSYYDSAIAYSADSGEEELYKEYLDLLIENNHTEKGIEVVKQAERVFSGSWVYLYYMNLYSLRKDSEKFEYYIGKIEYESLDSSLKSQYLTLKSDYQINNSQYDEARATLDIFWELDKYDPRYNLLYAQLSFEEGNLEDTGVYAKRAIEYDTQRLVTDDAQKLLAQID